MNMVQMGEDVAPEGHINEGLTLAERYAKYGIDPTEISARNQLLSAERKEAQAAGLAPDVPITERAAAWMAPDISAQKAAQRQRWMIAGAVVLVGGFLLYNASKKR